MSAAWRLSARECRVWAAAMKSLTLTAPGRLEWSTLPEADAPRAGEALVAIRAIGICGTDFSGYQGNYDVGNSKHRRDNEKDCTYKLLL
jgi:hypothetical protein